MPEPPPSPTPPYLHFNPPPTEQLSGFGPRRGSLSARRLKGSRRVAAACFSMASRYKVNAGETDKRRRILVWEGARAAQSTLGVDQCYWTVVLVVAAGRTLSVPFLTTTVAISKPLSLPFLPASRQSLPPPLPPPSN